MIRHSFPTTLQCAGRRLSLGSFPLLMGIVNVTPDSFSDGGAFLDPKRAIEHAHELVQAGADWIDIGGESTRPGAEPVATAEELRRVIPVIEALSGKVDALISIDTYKPEVAAEAVRAGAQIINDVTGFRDRGMVDWAAGTDVGCVVMHMRGTPADMMQKTDYQDVVAEVKGYLAGRIEELGRAGVAPERIMVDPGIGFAKRRPDNLRLLARLEDLANLGRPVLLGASRKRFLGEVTGRAEAAREPGTIATSVYGYLAGVHILRVHDVAAVRDALLVTQAIVEAGVEEAR